MMTANAKILAQQHLRGGGLLSEFMSCEQRRFIQEAIRGEEGDWFADKMLEMVNVIRETPVTYETEALDAADKVLRLHYFKGGVDAWIVERDVGDEGDVRGEGRQFQAFGKITVVGGGWSEAEWGYVSIADLIDAGVELDLHWRQRTVKEML